MGFAHKTPTGCAHNAFAQCTFVRLGDTMRPAQLYRSVRPNKSETKLNRATRALHEYERLYLILNRAEEDEKFLGCRELVHRHTLARSLSHFVHCHQDLHNARYVVLRCSTFYFRRSSAITAAEHLSLHFSDLQRAPRPLLFLLGFIVLIFG